MPKVFHPYRFPMHKNTSIWHPFTQMRSGGDPILIEKAKGVYLYDSYGKSYIDAISSWWVNIHGHSHPYIAEKIAEQATKLEHVIFAGFTHHPAQHLAERLLEIVPGNFSKVFFSDDGSTSVEVALKMALQFWYNKGENRKKIIAFEHAYHGDTFGAMSVAGRSAFSAPFDDFLFEVYHISAPIEGQAEESKNALKALAAKGDIAAFIFEPLIQGTAGMYMHAPEHLDELIRIAQQHQIVCIADEVMTGFGRTGKNFAMEYLKNKADILCLSKGITGGFMPLGVTLAQEKIFEAFYAEDRLKTFFHGHSYTANPLACSAANASLDLLLADACQQNIQRIAKDHIAFAERLRDNPFIKEVRQQGTIIAVELNTRETTSYFNTIRNDAYNFCLEHGVLIRPLGNILYLLPPYCITEDELQEVYHILEKAIEFLKKKYF